MVSFQHTTGNFAFFSAPWLRFRARGHFEDRFRFELATTGHTCAVQALCEPDRRNESAERPQARQHNSLSRCRFLSSVRARLVLRSSGRLAQKAARARPRTTRGNGGATVSRLMRDSDVSRPLPRVASAAWRPSTKQKSNRQGAKIAKRDQDPGLSAEDSSRRLRRFHASPPRSQPPLSLGLASLAAWRFSSTRSGGGVAEAGSAADRHTGLELSPWHTRRS